MFKYYQYFHLIWSLTFWFAQFRFMINQSDVHSPLLAILKLKLVYDLNRTTSSPNDSLIRRLLRLANYCFTNILFFVQFLKWFYDYRANRSFMGAEEATTSNTDEATNNSEYICEPRLHDKLAQNKAYKTLSESSLCPLCNKKRTNQCALSVSGFVFCYPCVFRYVKENNRCPLTHIPCSTKNIIRIYSDSPSNS